MTRRRTKADYQRAFDIPSLPFAGPGPDDNGARLILFPNGQRGTIWIESHDGARKFALSASDGPHGLGIRLDAIVGLPPRVWHDGRSIEACIYRPDECAQAYARWYAHEETEADIALLGESYRRAEGSN